MARRRGAVPGLITVLAAALLLVGGAGGAGGTDPITYGLDTLRTGWYPDQPRLSPAIVAGGTFGQLFKANVVGQVYAQPLVADNTLLVATEANWVYGLNPETGEQRWARNLGVPWNTRDVSCGDLAPTAGVTGTPVIDPATDTAYLFSKTYVDGAAVWFAHALDIRDGAERDGFPRRIEGSAANKPELEFGAKKQLQRTGLLLLNGVVYAGFGGLCDKDPYQGWIVGISPSGQITTMWASEESRGGIWQSGGGLVSDGPGQILFSTGNGKTVASPRPGKPPPPNLGESVVRAAVQADGSLTATDYFAPYDASKLDFADNDVGSAAPLALPDSFGTLQHPHLLVQAGKQGYVYLLDRDDLGGMGQGRNGGDRVLARIGPYGGVWAKPGVWPGDGGWIYLPANGLRTFRYGVDGAGNPTISLAVTSTDGWGYGSTAGVVTSDRLAPGSALLWTTWRPPGGDGSQLRAYDPVPTGGKLQLRYSAPIGQATKFALPGVSNGRVYVGTSDGHVLGFGAPVDQPLELPPLAFAPTTIGETSTLTATLTARAPVTVTALSTSDAVFDLGAPSTSPPAVLSTGETLSVPVTFAPASPGLVGAGLNVATSSGTVTLELSGTGRTLEPHLAASPTAVSFGGAPVGGNATGSVTFTNEGATALTIDEVDLPSAPFSTDGAPEAGETLAGGASLTISVTFQPTEIGTFIDTIGLETTGGDELVGLSGTAAPPPLLQISPAALEFGEVAVANGVTRTFTLTNAGGSTLTISKSKPPALGSFTALTGLPEGTTLAAGQSRVLPVRFRPIVLGLSSDSWAITGDDGSGAHVVAFSGTGVPAPPPPPPGPATPPTPPAPAPPAVSRPTRIASHGLSRRRPRTHVPARPLRAHPHRLLPGW